MLYWWYSCGLTHGCKKAVEILLLIDAEGKERESNLTAGTSYYREAGVEHNVINAGKELLVFIEIEIKSSSEESIDV